MITIIVSTKNRSDFLIRLLNYYAGNNYQHWISIGDSSDAYHAEQTKKTVKRLEGKLNIIYKQYPDLGVIETICELIQSIDTQYAVLVPDDDFLVPSSLKKCANFLEENPKYCAAHGIGSILSVKNDGPHGEVAKLNKYRQAAMESDSASQRLIKHLGSYSLTLFSVFRTCTWKRILKDVPIMKSKAFSDELLPCCLSVVLGKIKELDCFYLVRQVHNRRYLLPDTYDWITSPHWQPSYSIFKAALAEELVKHDGITIDEAFAIVKKAFWSYLAKGLQSKYQYRYGINDPEYRPSVRESLKKILKSIPSVSNYLLPTWHKIKPKRFNPDELSLEALLHPASPYHADFMPVYQAITKGELLK